MVTIDRKTTPEIISRRQKIRIPELPKKRIYTDDDVADFFNSFDEPELDEYENEADWSDDDDYLPEAEVDEGEDSYDDDSYDDDFDDFAVADESEAEIELPADDDSTDDAYEDVENEDIEIELTGDDEDENDTANLHSDNGNAFLIPEPDAEELLFRPDDYMNTLPFEVNANPEDILFQREQFDFYGIKLNGRKLELDANQFAIALCQKLTAKIFNTQLFLYNKRRGIFEPVTDAQFNAITYRILKGIADGIWNRNKQAEYREIFKYEVDQYEKFEYNRRYISFNNCTLDLITMKPQSHSPLLNSTNHVGYNYDPSAKCPLWEKTLMQIFLGDVDVIESFREMFGCFLLHGKGKAMDKLFILYGSGSNGKSLCTNVIRDVLTEKNCSSKALCDIGKRFGLSTIYDRFVNISSENEKVITDTAVFKALTSSDSVEIEKKYQDSYSAVPYVKLVCSTNKLPKFRDNSNGMIRRMHIFTFNAHFIDVEVGQNLRENECAVDRLLFEKLHQERAGILNWALIGTQRLLKNDYKFSMPAAVRQYNESFVLNVNPVRVFADSCITVSTKNRIRTTDVLSQYIMWAETHGVKNQDFHSNQRFHKEFKNCLDENDIPANIVQIKGNDYYCDLAIDSSYPLILPKCY